MNTIEDTRNDSANLKSHQAYGIRKGPEEFNRLVRQRSNEKQMQQVGSEIPEVEGKKLYIFTSNFTKILLKYHISR